MKIDSDLAIPATPERQRPAAEPASEARSSRVTINVRTPLQLQTLEATPSSPPSPSPMHRRRTPPSAASQSHAVNTTADEPDSVMPTNGTTSDAAVSSRSDSGSPPIEIISMAAEDDADFDDDDSITMLDDSGRSLEYDPSLSFPFHDSAESYMDTVNRLLTFLPTRKPLSSPIPLTKPGQL